MSASRSLTRALRPLAQGSQSTASTSTSTQTLSHASRSRTTTPSSSRSASTTVATASSAEAPAAAAYVHDPTPDVHLPRLARSEPELYAALRPPPVSAFAALTTRLGLIPSTLDAETRDRRIRLVHQACTHPSFQALVDKAKSANLNLDTDRSAAVSGLAKKDGPSALDSAQYLALMGETVEHHAALATVGNSLLGMLATEFLHLRYPNLPTRVLKAAVSAHVGPTTLADVGAELGLAAQGILRWNRDARVATSLNLTLKRGGRKGLPSSAPSSSNYRTLLTKDVAADTMRALTAVMFQELGLSATRRFVTAHLLNRSLNLTALLKFANPKHALASTCAKYNKPAPQSRMIAESGRLSISPIFVVGVWSGQTKIGEGSGSSIRMAEFRAAEDALRRLYLAETPLGEFQLPSSTLDAQFVGAGEADKRSANADVEQVPVFTPQPIGETEVLAVAGTNRS